MAILAAENHFRKGLAALAAYEPVVAAAHFQSAMQIERQRAAPRPEMRYLSYFGYAHALAYGAGQEALRACETAAKREFYNAEVFLNYGRVLSMAEKTTRALAAFERGRRLAPTNTALQLEINRLERRRRPPIAFLSRNHAVNIWLGRTLATMRLRSARAVFSPREASPS